MKKAYIAAFPHALPVMLGYVFLAIAFGLLLEQAGYSFLWAMLMSVVVYSGALQFACVGFLSGGVNLISIILISSVMNFRHIFYGITVLDKFKGTGIYKPYLIYSLSDEVFALDTSIQRDKDVDKGKFYFALASLCQVSWIIGSGVGGLLSQGLGFDLKGIEFSMTALFIVLFMDQMKQSKAYGIGVIGILASIISLWIVGPSYFIVLALILILGSILLMRKRGVTHE